MPLLRVGGACVTRRHGGSTVALVTGADGVVWRVLGDPLVPASAPGELDGATVAVKDVYAVAGHATGAGNPAWLAGAGTATKHATAVAELLRAGAAVVGIAQTDEFAYSIAGTNAHYGTPPNPAAPYRIPGGSSSGPASAVALGHVSIGLGTDTAGSVRVPASYQGLVGLRTTHGLLDRTGMLPLAPSFDAVGWLTRDAAALASLARALLPARAGVPLTRGVVVPAVTALADADVGAMFSTAADAMVRDGVLVGVDEADPDGIGSGRLAEWFDAFTTVQAHEAWAAHGAWVRAHPDALGPDVASRFARAATVDEDRADRARATVARARTRLLALLEPGTVLLLPTTSSPAPPRAAGPGSSAVEAARARTLRLTCLAGLAGAPAISLPAGRTDDGPVGVSALAAPGADRALVDLAAAVALRCPL